MGRNNGEVIAVYLSLQNPIDLTTKEGKNISADIKDSIKKEDGGIYHDDYVTEAIKRGYDGRILLGKIAKGGEIEVFSPTQIKSATNNNGNFNPSDPNIMH